MASITSGDLLGDYPERIKNCRDAKGMTQAQFAELIGVSYATVNRWGERAFPPQQAGLAASRRI